MGRPSGAKYQPVTRPTAVKAILPGLEGKQTKHGGKDGKRQALP